jgi:hypothetical protein
MEVEMQQLEAHIHPRNSSVQTRRPDQGLGEPGAVKREKILKPQQPNDDWRAQSLSSTDVLEPQTHPPFVSHDKKKQTLHSCQIAEIDIRLQDVKLR